MVLSDERNFQEKLDYFYDMVKSQILKHQHPVTGLFPVNLNDMSPKLSHVRDNVYCATVVWALRQAFVRLDDDEGRSYELGQCAVKCMRAILLCWMQQSSRLEMFKKSQNLSTCLHTMISYEKGECMYIDDYKHLQMDCVGLFVIQLAQMIYSGLQIIFTKAECAFMQNLIFYLERAYRIPDYGMWERGSKQNRNITELHASSIGMAKAALETVSGFNMFGEEGDQSTVQFVDIDAHSRNRIIMSNLLPRESASKGCDASLIPTLSWPAFATHSENLREKPLGRCLQRLRGPYGLKRFSRDGFATCMDSGGNYKPGELKNFEGIESQWPMFYAYLAIDRYIRGKTDEANEFSEKVYDLMQRLPDEDYPWLPKYYYVLQEDIEREKANPSSVDRKSNYYKEPASKFLWGQSVCITMQLLLSGCLTVGDLDPLSRSSRADDRPLILSKRYAVMQSKPVNLVIQVVLLSESVRLQQLLATYGIASQTPAQVEPISVCPPHELVKVGKYMGFCKRLGLSGRPDRPIGQLGTSKFYRIAGRTILCYPLMFEATDFYLIHDTQVLINEIIITAWKKQKARGR